ncbi:hypothetical protein Ancab_029870 [Ancistrocladus abbreviatus]
MKSLAYASLFFSFSLLSLLLLNTNAEASPPSSRIRRTHQFSGLKETARRMHNHIHGERTNEKKGMLLYPRRKAAEKATTEINFYSRKAGGAAGAYAGGAVATVAGHGSHRRNHASASRLTRLSSFVPVILSSIIVIYSFQTIF